MAPPSPSRSFTCPVTDAVYYSKHQFSLLTAVAKDLGLEKGETARLGISVNRQSSYWVSFRWQNKAWRSLGSGWESLLNKHRRLIKEGDTLVFTRHDDSGHYILQSERLDRYHYKRGYEPDELDDLYCPLNSSGAEEYTPTDTDSGAEYDSDEDSSDSNDGGDCNEIEAKIAALGNLNDEAKPNAGVQGNEDAGYVGDDEGNAEAGKN